MNFAEIMKEESTWTKTENGADCKNTTGSALLDFFSTIGSMRTRSEQDIIKKFKLACLESRISALLCLFYARDIRDGLGERRVFRILIRYAADVYPDIVKQILPLIPEYGRYDDLYSFIGTKLEEDMWNFISLQLDEDVSNMLEKKQVSLLAKWLKKADSSNPKTRKLGIYTAQKLHMSVYYYKRICKELRKYLEVTECKMSQKQWNEIEYNGVPSKAMLNYRSAFQRHDEHRFKEFLSAVDNGKTKINSGTLYPYEIVEKVLYNFEDSEVLEAQWKSLPNYLEKEMNALVMADVSNSMSGRPMATSIGLAMYFAERNTGSFHNLFMTFSSDPQFVEIKGETLADRVHYIQKSFWEMSTNLEKAFLKILELAVQNHCSSEDLPKSLIVISDMEIDACVDSQRSNFYDAMKKEYESLGYQIPNVVFWNVDSRKDTFLVDQKRSGVQLVSGQSASTFKHLVESIGKTPKELMDEVLFSDRYLPLLKELTKHMSFMKASL